MVAVPPAVTLPALLEIVVFAVEAEPGTVVIVLVVPLVPPVVPVTVVAVPDVVNVFNVTEATPFALVSDVAAENEPLASDLVQVTVWPAIANALLLASSICAETVTPLPAAGDVVLVVTS